MEDVTGSHQNLGLYTCEERSSISRGVLPWFQARIGLGAEHSTRSYMEFSNLFIIPVRMFYFWDDRSDGNIKRNCKVGRNRPSTPLQPLIQRARTCGSPVSALQTSNPENRHACLHRLRLNLYATAGSSNSSYGAEIGDDTAYGMTRNTRCEPDELNVGSTEHADCLNHAQVIHHMFVGNRRGSITSNRVANRCRGSRRSRPAA